MSEIDHNSKVDTPLYLHTNAVPLSAGGQVLHLGLRVGDVANKVITVGSESRCKILAELLDKPNVPAKDDTPLSPTTGGKENLVLTIQSKRGFVTHTGTFNGVPVSIVMINMGYPNMDFFVREVRAVTEGPLHIIRLGSCAGLRQDLPVGTIAVASEGSVFIRQNPDAWMSDETVGEEEEAEAPYVFHKVVPADENLSRVLIQELKAEFERGEGGGARSAVVGCLNASADSFYSSQGRIDPSFGDRNEDLMQTLLSRHPSAGSFEMETFHLLHLARICRKSVVHASAASLVYANRALDGAIALSRIDEIERRAGEAVLRAITTTPLIASKKL